MGRAYFDVAYGEPVNKLFLEELLERLSNLKDRAVRILTLIYERLIMSEDFSDVILGKLVKVLPATSIILDSQIT